MTSPKYEREHATIGASTNQCPTGKLAYITKAAAKKAASQVRSRNGEHLRPYHCGHCDRWHNGHLPTRVIRGEVSRDEHYRQKGIG